MSDYASAAGTRNPVAAKRQRDVVDYYEQTLDDYLSWSANGNMHFGFCRPGLDMFDREAQLAQLNTQVGARLGLADDTTPATPRIVDLGCGTGATLRQLLTEHPGWHAVGLSNVPRLVEYARAETRTSRLNDRLTVLCEDFHATSFPSARFDAALSIEAFCYGTGYAKRDILLEARRILRPGARLVIADGFFHDETPLPALIETCHRRMCDAWQIDTLARKPAVETALTELGFENIVFEDVSMNVLPSLFHVPGVTLAFASMLLREPGRATSLRWGHASAPLLAMVLGLARRHVGYYILSATKGQAKCQK